MINDIESFINFDEKETMIIEIPYKIGTIMESKKCSEVLVKISKYKLDVYKSQMMIYVGLSYNINQEYTIIDKEITLEELEKNWQRANTKTKIKKLY